jgi:hypothetical protein
MDSDSDDDLSDESSQTLCLKKVSKNVESFPDLLRALQHSRSTNDKLKACLAIEKYAKNNLINCHYRGRCLDAIEEIISAVKDRHSLNACALNCMHQFMMSCTLTDKEIVQYLQIIATVLTNKTYRNNDLSDQEFRVKVACMNVLAMMAEYDFIPQAQAEEYIRYNSYLLQSGDVNELSLSAVHAIGGSAKFIKDESVVEIIQMLFYYVNIKSNQRRSTSYYSKSIRQYSLWALSRIVKFNRIPKPFLKPITEAMINMVTEAQGYMATRYLAELILSDILDSHRDSGLWNKVIETIVKQLCCRDTLTRELLFNCMCRMIEYRLSHRSFDWIKKILKSRLCEKCDESSDHVCVEQILFRKIVAWFDELFNLPSVTAAQKVDILCAHIENSRAIVMENASAMLIKVLRDDQMRD